MVEYLSPRVIKLEGKVADAFFTGNGDSPDPRFFEEIGTLVAEYFKKEGAAQNVKLHVVPRHAATHLVRNIEVDYDGQQIKARDIAYKNIPVELQNSLEWHLAADARLPTGTYGVAVIMHK